MFTISEKIAFIQSVFGSGEVARNCSNIEVTCPICASQKQTTKKKLAIRLSDDVTHCWVCGFSSRSLLPLLKRFFSVDDLARYKAKFVSNRSIQRDSDTSEKQKLKLPSDFVFLAAVIKSKDPSVRKAIRYLYDRGLTERDLWYYKFGVSAVEQPGRVIMPSFDGHGALNFYTARAIDGRVKPKYINPPKEAVAKTEIIFNEINIDWTSELTIVEGPYDLTRCPDNSVPLQGDQLSEDSQLFNEIIYHETPCVVMLDDDAKLRSSQIAKKLVSYNIAVRVAALPDGFHDPGEMTRDQVLERIANAVPWAWEGHIREKFASIRMSL